MHIANFMSKNPVTGVNTINNIIRLTKKQIPIDAPYVHGITRRILARELNMLFNKLRKEDLLIGLENINEFSEE